jgi:hypothetical protein
MSMARPLNRLKYMAVDTFARSTQALKDFILGALLGIGIALICLSFPRSRLSCRHQTHDFFGTRLVDFRLYSLWRQQLKLAKGSPDLPSNCSSLRDLDCTHSNYETRKSPVSVFIVTTSPYWDWVICAPAAFLGCGSRFSGSLSGIEP